MTCLQRATWAVVVLVLSSPSPAPARVCRSSLQANLWQAHDWFSLGAELRGIYIGADVGDALPKSQPESFWANDFAGGVRLQAGFYPLDQLAVVGELDLTNKGLRVVQALAEYDREYWGTTAGVQTLSFGSGVLLDQRFLALDLRLKTRIATLDLFGGVTNRFLMKSGTNCMFTGYTAHTQKWRSLGTGLNNAVGGAIVSLRNLQPFRLDGIYLLSWPDTEGLRGHAAALSLTGPIVGRHLSLAAETMVLFDAEGTVQPGALVELRARPAHGLRIRLGAAAGFGDRNDLRLTPVYENLSWGMLQRFNIEQGRLVMARAAYNIGGLVKPFVGYYLRFREMDRRSEDLGDELNAGVDVSVSRHYHLRASYIATNLAGPHRPSHIGLLEIRLILGSQLDSLFN